MKDCAFDRNDVCSALRCKKCKGCNFRKTREELIEGRKKSADRISKLPLKTKQYIYRKYYDLDRTKTEW